MRFGPRTADGQTPYAMVSTSLAPMGTELPLTLYCTHPARCTRIDIMVPLHPLTCHRAAPVLRDKGCRLYCTVHILQDAVTHKHRPFVRPWRRAFKTQNA